MGFKATFWDGTQIDITSNGTTLSVSDNSNYREYSDTAQNGAVNSITLSTDASDYDDFYKNLEIEIIGGTGIGSWAICTGYNGTTKVASVASWSGTSPAASSVYEIGERGHLKSYFTDFRKLYIYTPTLTYLFSTLGDGDATTAVPSTATLPITDTYNYTDGDGVYQCVLYALPTWSATVAYLYTNKPYVYYGGKMWKLLKNDTGTAPGIDATVWEEITDIEDLGTRYIADNRIAIYCDIMECWRNKVAAAYGALTCNPCNQEILIRNLDVQKAFQISLGTDMIPVLAAKNLWTSADGNANVTDTINAMKQICCCDEI